MNNLNSHDPEISMLGTDPREMKIQIHDEDMSRDSQRGFVEISINRE